jgi:hypothetical protein
MTWQAQLKGDPLPWLLSHEEAGVRYLALRDLCNLPPDNPELKAARAAAHREGPIATILDQMNEAGYWAQPGAGYAPKYHGTVWSIIMLAQLGASAEADERLATASGYILDHALAPGGQFSYNGAPSGTIACLHGNLCWALLELGCRDARLEAAFDWLARSVTGEGVAPNTERRAPRRYYAYTCGPDFACGANNGRPCAWGAVKLMLAVTKWPADRRTPELDRAVARGVDFLLGVDPSTAAYPTYSGGKPSGDWWKFGFPVFYITDLLQNVEALVGLGYGRDPRLGRALQVIREKQDAEGRWPLEYHYGTKTWVSFGRKGQPNPWVTLRALRVLKAVG